MMRLPRTLLALVLPTLAACGDEPPPPVGGGAVGDEPFDTTITPSPLDSVTAPPAEPGGQPGLPGTPAPSASYRTSGGGDCYVYARHVVAVRPREDAPGQDVVALPRDAGPSARALCDAPAGRATVALTDPDEPTFFAGLVGDLLLVDSGTGPNERTLRAYDLADEGKLTLDTPYEEPAQVEGRSLVYQEPLDDYDDPDALAATEVDCPEATEWFESGLAVGVNRVARFDLAARQVIPSDSLTCVPLQ